jgi:hypothetical protein
MERSAIRGCAASGSTAPGFRGACHRAALRADPLASSGLRLLVACRFCRTTGRSVRLSRIWPARVDLGSAKSLRQSADFMRRFKVIWVVQSLRKNICLRRRKNSERMRAMRKLPVVLICRNPTALPSPPNQRQIRRVPPSPRGAYASSRTLRRDAMDALAAQDERRLRRTAKSCGPDTPTLVSSLWKLFRRRRWQKSPVTGESTNISR